MALLNFSNIPNGQVSGLDGETLAWIASASSERHVREISDEFSLELDNFEFSSFENILPEDVEEELNKIESASIPFSSKQQMKSHANKFRNFLNENNLDSNFEALPEFILSKYLRFFYSKLQTNKGNVYAPASLICIRAGLQRYLSCEVKREINIISGEKFAAANRMMKAMVGKFLSSSKNSKPEEKYPPIEEQDMVKIRSSFTRETPQLLQQEFIFNCLYHFGLRGRETLKLLKKESFELETDGEGRQYLRLGGAALSKNCKAGLCAKEFDNAKKVRAYECNERKFECPVECYKIYMDKLPQENPSVFPKPLTTYKKPISQWYCSSKVLGKNSLGNLLSTLSDQLNLSKRYTNHCVRVTTVQVLREQGYQNEDIALVTGHKNPNSVQRYAKRRRDDSFFQQSEALQVGTSAVVSRKVVPIGKSGRVSIEEVQDKESAVDLVSNCQTSVFFSGKFQNCNFNIKQ